MRNTYRNNSQRSRDSSRILPLHDHPQSGRTPQIATRANSGLKARWLVLAASALGVCTFVVYAQTSRHAFLHYDDNVYVTDNPHIQTGGLWKTVGWALTTGYAANWHPLTWLSHWLDYQLYGLNPAGHHLTNVILHMANTVLLFLLLHRMTGALWRSAFVAALFALHPLHVESVAWVAERKDVLSAFFWFLTMWAYVRYAERPRAGRYLVVVVLFGLGLMAKPMLVTLPFVLLLLDYWPLARLGHNTGRLAREAKTCVIEKIPLFALSAVSSGITLIAQHRGGAMSGMEHLPFSSRAANAVVSYVAYMIKMVWPTGLASPYPHPEHTLPAWHVAGSALVLILFSLVTARQVRRRPYALIGWLWFLGALVPVIGLIQVGNQAMADRYTYVPLIGLFIVVAWGLRDLMGNRRMARTVVATGSGIALALLAALTWAQVGYWRNDAALFSHAVAVTRGNYVAHNNLGNALDQMGRTDEAIRHYQQALAIRPNHVRAYVGLGNALFKKRLPQEAMRAYLKALELRPDHAPAHINLGYLLVMNGQVEQGMQHLLRAVEIEPENPEAHNNLGVAFGVQQRLDEAIAEFSAAIALRPNYPEARQNLELALMKKRGG